MRSQQCADSEDLTTKSLHYFIYIIGIYIVLSLVTTIALLIWYLLTPDTIIQTNFSCPPNPCPSITMTSGSSTQNTSLMLNTSTNTIPTSAITISSSSTTTNKKRTYKESCDQLYDCYIEYGLLCEYGWNETKSCLCEGSHYWSSQENKCLRKGEMNDACDVDYQCHREIGLVCDKPFNISRKICICAGNIYWAKDSNCGQTGIHRIVDCINENYATTCLILDINNIYHMMTIRSITEKEFSFDWFLIDNRNLSELSQLSCTFNNETKYCFGLNIEDSLKLAQFTRKGFHSIENLGGNNRGNVFGLTDRNNVSVYVRNFQNILYRRIITDDEVLPAQNIALGLTGDPICYIQELINTRQIYCFARNSVYGLTEYAELSTHTWRATQLGNNSTGRIRDETAPACSYVGQVYRYCFAIFENGQIYRILFNSGVWNTWQSISGGRQLQFINQPVFFTSKPLNESSSDQTCYLIAIDTNNNLQLSTNVNCAVSNNFSEWIPIETNLKFKQFDKIFRLRDNNIGVLGIDSQNRAYYIFLNPTTNRFTLPRPAFTIKPEQFRP